MTELNRYFDSKHCVTFDKIDSTSAYIKRLYGHIPLPFTCRALSQTSGYGQHQRSWSSLPGSLLFSVAVRLPLPVHKVPAISQRLIITIHKVLAQHTDQNIYLKWPNDLYTDQGKVAGLLVEVLKNNKSYTDICVGFGLNLSKASKIHLHDSSLHFVTLQTQSEHDQLFKALVSEIVQFVDSNTLPTFDSESLVYWQRYDYFTSGERVSTLFNGQTTEGIYLGIDSLGHVNIQHLDQKICYHSGSLSIRKIT